MILFGQRFGDIEDVEDEVGFFQGFPTATDALAFDVVGGRAQAGGVDEHDGDAANVGGFLDGVAGRAGGVGDDGAVVAEQLVEEAGLSDVGPAHDRGANPAAEDLAFARRAE